jgi:very-short-patch-repair endonuclease
MTEPTSIERTFETRAKQCGLPPFVTQFCFAPPRRWRFDVAYPAHKLAIELEGGTWINGFHNSGAGYEKDAIKYNTAAVMGWTVLRFTTSMLRTNPAGCMDLIRRILERGAEPQGEER